MILHVVRYFPTATETFVHDEVAGLRERGLEVEIAAFDAREDVGVPAPAPVWAQPHRWGWLSALPGLVAEWLRAPGWASPRVLWLAALLRRRGVRRVHVHFAGEAASWAAAAAARVGVPWSVTVHAADLYKPLPGLGALLRGAAAVATVSEANRRELRERHGVDATVLRCGVDLPPAPRPALPAGAPLLTVARAVPKKGLDVLVAALRLLRERGAALPPVLAYSDAAGLDGVEVRPLAPHPEVLAAIRGARLFVLPCRVAPDGDRDGIPVVLLEALAAGVPVVTTPVSGIPEVVDEAVGWLVPPDAPEALAAAIAEALSDPEEARRRGARGPARLVERGFARDLALSRVRDWMEGGPGSG